MLAPTRLAARILFTLLPLATLMTLAAPRPAHAHCDALDGPVAADARVALEAGELEPVLRWVSPTDEAELRAAFNRTLEVRTLGESARALADRAFLEALVRLHRKSEGAPYTGLKPAGAATEPGVEAADRALETGEGAALAKAVSARVRQQIQDRFQEVRALARHADRSVEDGRRWVAAYVDYVHFIRGLHAAMSGEGPHAHASSEGEDAALGPASSQNR